MDPFIAQIVMFGGNFAPRGWAFCDGQLLSIAQNTALFSILGTTYGGDGRTTFGLPDLRGRVSIHPGHGPGLSNYQLGQKGGTETVTLTAAQMPSHNHQIHAANTGGDDTNPTTAKGFAVAGDDLYIENTPATTMQSDIVSSVGGSQAHNNVQPFECVNYIIALVGTYPSRS